MGSISHSTSVKQAELQEELMIFDASKYADPIFSWKDPVGPTDLEFLNSTALGLGYATTFLLETLTTAICTILN